MLQIAECETCHSRRKENTTDCLTIGCDDCSFFGGCMRGKKVVIDGQLIMTEYGYCNKYNVEIYGLKTVCEGFKCGVKQCF